MRSTGLPVMLSVEGKRCVVVGGGSIGGRRARALIESGAEVLVVDPRSVEIPGACAHVGPFEPECLDGAFLVVVATNDPATNAEVVAEAKARGVLVNDAATGGASGAGDIAMMATVDRGPLRVGVAGAGPVASRWIRDRIEAMLEPGLGVWAEEMEALRARLVPSASPGVSKAEVLWNVASDPRVREALEVGEARAIRSAIHEAACRAGEVAT